MTTIIRRGDGKQLVDSLRSDVERSIRQHEGKFKKVVLRDFREGIRNREVDEQVRWCNKWLAMYRGAKR